MFIRNINKQFLELRQNKNNVEIYAYCTYKRVSQFVLLAPKKTDNDVEIVKIVNVLKKI